MNRMIIAIPTGLIAGALVGLMMGGLWLHWQLGAGMNAGHPFVLVTEFPGLRMAGQDPWRSAYAIVLAGAVLLSLLAVAFTLTHRLTTYGTAHFQTRREIRRNGLLQPVGAGLVFGKFGKPHKKGRFVCGSYDRFPHALVAAPTRSGKGVGYVMPNTLLFPGSCVVMDVKGDIFEATARHRQAQGDQVIRIAPFDFEHPSHRYNPLERISRIADTDQRFTELSKLASYFLIPKNEKGGASDFIVGARQLFVAGGMLAIERGTPTLGAIARILFDTGNKEAAYAALAAEARHAQTATIFLNFSGHSDRTLSSYASVLDGSGLGLWLNPRIDKITSANDFSWGDIRRRPHAVYVVANSDDIPTLSPLLRLMFGELIATMRAHIRAVVAPGVEAQRGHGGKAGDCPSGQIGCRERAADRLGYGEEPPCRLPRAGCPAGCPATCCLDRGRIGMGKRKKPACLGSHILEVEKARRCADEVEQIAVFAGGGI
ncbi:type IV secretory system conjugative DNA transfer family protein [Paracoccus angustae]|uniref:Type IV secretory system conjugative DNA transfer family protein n=1 Tax=Paracoccus angustae TaxID=1671480 RepID=A0ABV7UBE1_9RHOB